MSSEGEVNDVLWILLSRSDFSGMFLAMFQSHCHGAKQHCSREMRETSGT